MTAPFSIAVDAMSGDHGAAVAVPAALDVLAGEPALELILVGRADAIGALLPADACRNAAGSWRPARSWAWTSVRRTRSVAEDSSMRVAINLVESGDAVACVSAGNTGALLATARFVLGMIEGVDRPAMCRLSPRCMGTR